MSHEGPQWVVLTEKCRESGIDPAAFLREKLLELDERKRILLTPRKAWFNANRQKYNEFASKVLGRALTESEMHDPRDGLAPWIARCYNRSARVKSIDLSIRRLLLKESGGRCAICGEPLTTGTTHVDHKMPLAEGGGNHTLNLQALCEVCNQGKRDYDEKTAHIAARPWYEPRQKLVKGEVALSTTKRFCVLTRDGSACQRCGIKASEAALKVVSRVPEEAGGQLIYDNLVTICLRCVQG